MLLLAAASSSALNWFRKKIPVAGTACVALCLHDAAAWFYILVDHYCAIQLPKLMVQTTPVLKWSMGMIYIIMMIGLGL